MISFDEAIKRCKKASPKYSIDPNVHLNLTEQQEKSVETLRVTFRNNIEHFVPKTWLIETGGFPVIANDILDIIYFLAVKMNNYSNFTSDQIAEIKKSINTSKKKLSKNISHMLPGLRKI